MERERLVVYVTTAEERARAKGIYRNTYNYMLSRCPVAEEQYVDELTECQQNAINIIRIMDEDNWVKGIGGKTNWARIVRGAHGNEGVFKCVAYILDC
jgi:hypothetical protein